MRHKYLFLLLFFVCSQTLAADGLGRLFLTAEQRTQLDIARARHDPRLPLTPQAEPVATAPAPTVSKGPDTVTYNGAVRRSDGKSTVWINGRPISERNRIRDSHEVNVVGMRSDGAVSVAIPQASRTASLKVGQRLDINSGKIEESYIWHATLPRSGKATSPAAIPPEVTQPVHTHSPAATSSVTKLARPLPESHINQIGPNSTTEPSVSANKK